MLYEKIPLSEEDSSIYMEIYIADAIYNFKRGAILVIPGGGYNGVCSDREGEPIAQAFIPKGYNAFVLHYSTGRKRPFPAQLIEASKAIKHIRDNADKYGIDPEKLFVVGFSAGGHLAGCLGTMWYSNDIYDKVDMPYGYNRPTGVMLIYPVVNGLEEFGHIDSFRNLLCADTPSKVMLEKCSIDSQVGEFTAPMFMVHTSNDQVVNVQNSLSLANALAQAHKTFELHIYPDAPHGVALGNEITECGVSKWNNKAISTWVEQAAVWADAIVNLDNANI